MPRLIICPDCERKLRVPDDLLGKKVRCPGCSVLFKALASAGGAAGPAAEDKEEPPPPPRRSADRDERVADSPRSRRRADEDEEDDRPRRSRADDFEEEEERDRDSRSQKAGWNKVRLGIMLVMIGTWIWVGAAALYGLITLLGAALLAGGVLPNFAGIMMLGGQGLVALCTFIEWVLRMVGYGLCVLVPPRRETGLRPLSITAFALLAFAALLVLLTLVIGFFSAASFSLRAFAGFGIIGTLLILASGLCAIASFIVYLFFLRSVCNNIRARHLAGQPITVLLTFVGYWFIAAILLAILIAIGGSIGPAAGGFMTQESANKARRAMQTWTVIFGIVMLLLGGTYLGINAWYARVLQAIRDAVTSYRRRL